MSRKVLYALLVAMVLFSPAYGQYMTMGNHIIKNYNYYKLTEHQKKVAQRGWITFSKPSTTVDVTTHLSSPAINYTPPVLAVEKNLNLSGLSVASGYGIDMGYFYPMFYVGRANAFGLEAGASAYEYRYNVGPLTYAPGYLLTDQSFIGKIGFPIGFVYKSGGPASLNKRDKVVFSLGCGLSPTMTIGKIIAADTRFEARRYVMAEFGVLMGLAWIVRVTFYPGQTMLINQPGNDLSSVSKWVSPAPGGTMDVLATSSNELILSVGMMPFSWAWKKKGRY